MTQSSFSIFFFFNDTATTEIYTLSLHDALPISPRLSAERRTDETCLDRAEFTTPGASRYYRMGRQSFTDRKSTRLNSSHSQISYAVFCLKKKKNTSIISTQRFA